MGALTGSDAFDSQFTGYRIRYLLPSTYKGPHKVPGRNYLPTYLPREEAEYLYRGREREKEE